MMTIPLKLFGKNREVRAQEVQVMELVALAIIQVVILEIQVLLMARRIRLTQVHQVLQEMVQEIHREETASVQATMATSLAVLQLLLYRCLE